MKKLVRILLVCVTIASVCSCKAILIKIKGVSKPRFENKESVLNYLSTISPESGDGVFVGQDSLQFFHLLKMIKELPTVDFYNSKGELIEYSQTGGCNGKAEEFAEKLTRNMVYTVDSSYRMKDVEKKVVSIKENNGLLSQDCDFVLFVYWAKYMGKMNQDVLDVMKALRNNKQLKAKVYLINMDFQSNWGMKKIPRINFN